jgi:drug/metabolite transporter (DMT)-like permease
VRSRYAIQVMIVGAAWGAVYPLTTVVLRESSAATVVAIRTGFAAVALLPFTLQPRVLTALRRRFPAMATAAVLQATAPLVLLTVGQQYVSASLAGILASSQPVWVAVLTILLDRTGRGHGRQLTGVLVGLTGVALLFGRDLRVNTGSLAGGTAILGSAILFAAGAVYIHRRLADVPAVGMAAVAMTLSAAVLVPVAGLAGATVPDATSLGRLFALGVATGAPLILFYSLIQRAGAISANLAAYLAPGFAVVYGVLLLDERTNPATIAGLALIIIGSVVASGWPANRRVEFLRDPRP